MQIERRGTTLGPLHGPAAKGREGAAAKHELCQEQRCRREPEDIIAAERDELATERRAHAAAGKDAEPNEAGAEARLGRVGVHGERAWAA